MPQFRKLHTKIIDSLDVDAMSSDFVRLTWTWLQLIACKDGRGMMHGGWLKSKLYPLRADVMPQMLIDAMHEFFELGMITLYSDNGRDYFQINKWHEYQNTSREAQSTYPAPTRELVESYSGVSQELVERTSSYLFLSMSDLKGDEKSEIVTALCNICRNAGVTDIKTLDMADWLIEVGESAKSVGAFGEWYALHAEERPYLKSVKTFWEDFKNNRIPHFSKLKGGADAIDGLLDSIRAGQTAGVDYNRFIENLPSEQAALWKLSGLKWGDVRTMTIKQTDALRFSFQKVGA